MSSRLLFCLFCLLALAACAATGPVSAPIAAGAAAAVAVFDQLLAGGVIEPVQHQMLVSSIAAMDQSVHAVVEAQKGALTTGEAATAAGGLTAAIVGGIRAWRGPSTKSKTA